MVMGMGMGMGMVMVMVTVMVIVVVMVMVMVMFVVVVVVVVVVKDESVGGVVCVCVVCCALFVRLFLVWLPLSIGVVGRFGCFESGTHQSRSLWSPFSSHLVP